MTPINRAEETRERSFAAGSDEELSVAPRQCDARHNLAHVHVDVPLRQA
jgi:hypothetical protein